MDPIEIGNLFTAAEHGRFTKKINANRNQNIKTQQVYDILHVTGTHIN